MAHTNEPEAKNLVPSAFHVAAYVDGQPVYAPIPPRQGARAGAAWQPGKPGPPR